MPVRIYIDPGHGGSDPGAVGNGLQEKDLTLTIGLKFRDYLLQFEGVQVRMSRTTDKTVSLSQRVSDANKWGADFFVSIHINAGGGVGFETYCYTSIKDGSRTDRLRDDIHNKVMDQKVFTRDRGRKFANYHVIRETTMPACLTENGFIDNKTDADILKDETNLNKIALGHALGVAAAFGLKKKVQPKNNNKGVDDMLDKAIVINSFADYPFAESLANKLACPIYTRNVAWGKKVAKTLYVVGGDTKDLKAEKFVVLSGSNRFDTAEKVRQYMAKL